MDRKQVLFSFGFSLSVIFLRAKKTPENAEMSKAEVCVPTLPKGIKFSQFITAFGLKLVESRQKADREVSESLSFLFQVTYFNNI